MKNIKSILILFLLMFSISNVALANDVDERIDKIINASPQEKEILIKELKDDISTKKYNKTDTKQAAKSNKTIDEKIQNRESKSIPTSRCGTGKCGSSHGSKCGSSNNSKCGGGSSHGSKCGSSKCGMGK